MAPMSRNITYPPEKGVFPLDHFAECQKVARSYLACLDRNDAEAGPCKELAKKYFECRMDRNLMVKQDIAELGIDPVIVETKSEPAAGGKGSSDS